MPSSVNRLFFMGSSPLGRKPFSQVTDGSKNPGRSPALRARGRDAG